MKHRIPGLLILAALMLPAAAFSVWAETAERPPQGVLWTGLGLSAAAGQTVWDAEGRTGPGSLQYIALGFRAEYGVIPWASLSARWEPAALLSGLAGAGDVGRTGDFCLGLRLGILGDGGLFGQAGVLRLSVTAGAKAPLDPGADTVWEPDTHLWGANLGASCDYLVSQWFQLNLGATFFINPEQASRNPAYTSGIAKVNHPLDMKLELEPRFSILNPDGVVFTMPIVYDYAAETTVRDQAIGDGAHVISLGLGYTIVVQEAALPFEVGLHCYVPLYGVNHVRLPRVEMTGKIAIPILRSNEPSEE
jgi:hypothetical protein